MSDTSAASVNLRGLNRRGMSVHRASYRTMLASAITHTAKAMCGCTSMCMCTPMPTRSQRPEPDDGGAS